MTTATDTVPSASSSERLRILTTNNVIAMVGLSSDPMRPSHFAAIYMQAEGYQIVPVNPKYAGQKILGETVYASLSDIPFKVDIVDVFRKPEECPGLAEEATKIGAKVFWIQLGLESDEAGRIARAAGLEFVQNRCVKIEHARFFGGMNLVGLNTGVITGRRSLVR
jgi:predicted CoA-binding protein